MSNRSRWLLGLLISVAALVAALWGIDWGQTLGALQRADFAYLLLALGSLLLALVTRAFRWQVLLGEGVGLGRCWSVLNIGYLVNTVLPLRIGEVVRAYLISRGRKFGGAHALSSVVLERVLDVLSVVLLLGVALRYVQASGAVRAAGTVMALLGVGGLLAMLVAALWPGLVRRVADPLIARMFRASAPRWSAWLAGALDGLSSLREPVRLIQVIGWNLLVWAFAIGTTYSTARAFLPSVSWGAATFVLAVLGLGVAVPSSPGQIGVYEATARYAFELTGVASTEGLAIGVIMHVMNLLAVVVFGAVALVREGDSLGQLAGETTAWLARLQGRGDAAPSAADVEVRAADGRAHAVKGEEPRP